MGYYLMTEEIEIDPLIGTSALFAAEYLAIESPGLVEAIDGKGKVETVVHTCLIFVQHGPKAQEPWIA
jgi:hypothetical protein